MNNLNLNGLNTIKPDKELIDRTVVKVMENAKSKTYINVKKSALAAASLTLIVSTASVYYFNNSADSGKVASNKTVIDTKSGNNMAQEIPENGSLVAVNDDSKKEKAEAPANSNAAAAETVANSNVAAPESAINSDFTKDETAANPNVAKSETEVISNFTNPVTEGETKKSEPVVIEKNNTEATEVKTSDSTIKTLTNSKDSALDSKVTDSKGQNTVNVAINEPVKENSGIEIPALVIKPSNGALGRMFPLVVYKGKIYTDSNTLIDTQNIKSLLGERIGKTKNSIDEWNVKDKSSEELASNIGEQDIYTVKGYDDSFRIMSYSEFNGQVFVQFFDCLNGITVKSGKDIFGKLNLVNNIESAKFRSFDDWNNGIDNYTSFNNLKELNEALGSINNAVPYTAETVGNEIDNSRNNNEFREITLKLKDGSEVKFTALKNGYVYYGHSNIYFKIDNSAINKLWQ